MTAMKHRGVVVLRIGHRPGRDKRISTHVGLVARAFGARGIVYAGHVEDGVLESLRKVVERWGGPFDVCRVDSYQSFIRSWKERGGTVVHLTMYGENLQSSDVLERIARSKGELLVIVGAEKVPPDVYELSDFNVAVGNQPHSEVSALAVFLDRLFGGEELVREFTNAKLKVIPSSKGKKVVHLYSTDEPKSVHRAGREDPRQARRPYS